MDESGGLENRYGESHRGFESYSHRHIRRGAGVVELDCLLSSYGESHRGFESHPLRSNGYPLPVVSF